VQVTYHRERKFSFMIVMVPTLQHGNTICIAPAVRSGRRSDQGLSSNAGVWEPIAEVEVVNVHRPAQLVGNAPLGVAQLFLILVVAMVAAPSFISRHKPRTSAHE